jgi:hypothetical protein
MALNETIDNILNNIKSDYNAINNEEFNEYIADMNAFNAKYKTSGEIKECSINLNSVYSIINSNFVKIREKIDEIFNSIKDLEKQKEKITKLIDGTYECIKVNMNNPDFDIKLPIDTFSDENIQKLFEKNIINHSVLQEEIKMRQIKKDYPTNETKLVYIKELDDKIVMNKQEILNNINIILRINFIKNKIQTIKQHMYINNQFIDICKNYNIDIYPKLNFQEIIQESGSEQNSKPCQELIEELVLNPDLVVDDIPPPPQMLEQNLNNIKKPMTPPLNIKKSMTPPLNIKKPMTPPLNIKKPMTPPPNIKKPMTPPPNIKKPMTPPPNSNMKELSVVPSTNVNIAPEDIYLEKICRHGMQCNFINDPSKCGYNHIIIGKPIPDKFSSNKINKGDVIPPDFCKSEKPWEKSNIRCHNINCNLVHCTGRVSFLKKYYTPTTIEYTRKRKHEENYPKSELDHVLEDFRKNSCNQGNSSSRSNSRERGLEYNYNSGSQYQSTYYHAEPQAPSPAYYKYHYNYTVHHNPDDL